MFVAFLGAAIATFVVVRVAAEMNGGSTASVIPRPVGSDAPDYRVGAKVGALLFGGISVAMAAAHPIHAHVLVTVAFIVLALVLISRSLWLVLVPLSVPALDF